MKADAWGYPEEKRRGWERGVNRQFRLPMLPVQGKK